jgi:hypothetical protein
VEPRDRPFPDGGLTTSDALPAFLDFLLLTAVNKVAGLDDERARRAVVPTSPTMTLLGVLAHLTAVLRQHIQIHIGGADLPSLFREGDPSFEFRLGVDDTVDRVVAAFDEEWERSGRTLAGVDLDSFITVYGEPSRAGRLLVDVVQETARHVGHMDLLRELIDGSVGE